MAAPINLVNLLAHQPVNWLARQLVNLSMCCRTELDLQRHNVHRKPTKSAPLPLRKVVFTFSLFHPFTFKGRSHFFTFSPFHSFTFKGRSFFSPFHSFTFSPFHLYKPSFVAIVVLGVIQCQ